MSLDVRACYWVPAAPQLSASRGTLLRRRQGAEAASAEPAEPGVDSIRLSRRCPASHAPAEQRSLAHRESVAAKHDDTSSLERVVPVETAWTLPIERSSQLS